MPTKILCVGALVAAVMAGRAEADSTLDYPAASTPVAAGFTPNPLVNSYTVGQRFTTGTDTLLTSFEFYGYFGSKDSTFSISVWTGNIPGGITAEPAGPVLYSTTVTANPPALDYVALIITPATPVVLAPNTTYLASFSAPNGFEVHSFYLAADNYPGGGSADQSPVGSLWEIGTTSLAFKTTFETAPPATPLPQTGLVMAALLPLVLVRRGMRRSWCAAR